MSGNIRCILSLRTTVLLACFVFSLQFFQHVSIADSCVSNCRELLDRSEHSHSVPLKLEIKGMDRFKRWACSGFRDRRKSLDGAVCANAGSWNRASPALLMSGTRDFRLSYFSHSFLFTLCVCQSWEQLKLVHMAVEFTASFFFVWQGKQVRLQISFVILISSWFLTDSEKIFSLNLSSHRNSKRPIPLETFLVFPPFSGFFFPNLCFGIQT